MSNLSMEVQTTARSNEPSVLLRFAGREDFLDSLATHEARYAARWQAETSLPAALSPATCLRGYCRFCRSEASFELPSLATGVNVNLREELICSGCGLNARVRAGLALLQQETESVPRPAIYITEQATCAYAQLLRRHPYLVGTEFFKGLAGRMRLEIYLARTTGRILSTRFGDVTALPFSDASFDAVVSFDVLEHVPDYQKALREFARVLRPRGCLVLTAPFLPGEYETQDLARLLSDGSIEYLRDPEYHGDPLSHKGVLCFHQFGWDLLDRTRDAGFATAEFLLSWSLNEAELGGCWTMVATR